MAEIDKSLTEVTKSVEIDGPEEQVELQEDIVETLPNAGETEIIPTEDGGVEINFEPGAFNQAQSENHFDNLAELLPDDILGPLGSELNQNYMDYKESRKEWERTYITGLDLLGFKYEDRTEPFSGAAGATHPVLAEAVTQFQAQAYKELLPADGPVRTQIIGAPTPEKEMQSTRVKDFMNYQLMDQMKEYEPEFDQLLFYLPLAGSAFKKVYYDQLLGRAVSKFVPAEDLIVPYSATSLEDATAVVHLVKTKENDLTKQMVSGFYRNVEIGQPGETESDLERKERELEGITKTKDEDIYNILEFHVDLDLEGFEDRDQQGQPTGVKLPYIVTIEEASREILSIRRNYEIGDPLRKKISYFVHFKFLPGLGFYGFGLIHMIGGLSRTATAALRSLLDAGTLSNLPAGFKMRGIRIRDDAQSITPGEFRDVDAPGGNIKDAFMALPFKEPSQTLLQLMGVVVSAGQRFASTADLQVGDGNQQAAVGTTVALLERGSRTMSAIHKRIYVSLKNEFKMLARVFKLYLPEQYPYDVVGGQRMIKKQDFDDKVDILPIADPNIFSQTQRISIAQAELQLAQSNPAMHNMYNAYRAMYEALGVKNIDMILKPVARPVPMDPSVEAIQALAGKPFQAFKGQDHRAHITAHLNFMTSSMARNNPMVTASMQKNIFEHISLMALEQVEVEFKDQILQMQQMQQQMQANPALAQDPQLQQQMMALNMQIESRKAVLIAEMFEDYAKEEQELMGEYGNDPIAKLKARELDIRAKDDFVKAEQAQEKINLDRMKAMMNQQNKDEKLEQNEELAELRAATSLAKQEMANRSKIHDFGRNFRKK
tara:strand:- start:23051 stop:25540 length:2490 start_codon:yes stop_codon:yes gene_type:complete